MAWFCLVFVCLCMFLSLFPFVFFYCVSMFILCYYNKECLTCLCNDYGSCQCFPQPPDPVGLIIKRGFNIYLVWLLHKSSVPVIDILYQGAYTYSLLGWLASAFLYTKVLLHNTLPFVLFMVLYNWFVLILQIFFFIYLYYLIWYLSQDGNVQLLRNYWIY